MAYLMRKTPRSSFMRGMGAAAAPPDETPPIIAQTTMSPVAIVAQMPPTPAPMPPVSFSRGLSTYLLWGGAAYLAYWLLFKE
jgi:hypothetical protein